MLLNYDPKLLFSSFYQSTPRVDNQTFLGAKAYYLKKLFSYKFPVPPGFIITTEWFRDRKAVKQFPEMYKAILGIIKEKIRELEKLLKKVRRPAKSFVIICTFRNSNFDARGYGFNIEYRNE